MEQKRLRLGIAGLGRAFSLMLPTLAGDARIHMVAGADPRAEARAQFERDFSGRSFDTVEAMCESADIDAIYISTPHQFHRAHVEAAARNGKHVLVEKPMSLSIADCAAMIEAAQRGGVHMVVGHSHSFDRPIARAREIVASGEIGRLRMINAMQFTDFLYRPRRPEELQTDQGGGVIFNQAPHQVDNVRLIAGGRTKSVRASVGMWDPSRPTEGAYQAFLTFENDVTAAISYSGYGHFDTDEFCDWIAESGQRKDPDRYGTARAALNGVDPQAELALKQQLNYGGEKYTPPHGVNPATRWHQHFGLLVASCEQGDLRPQPHGVMIYGDSIRRFEPLEPPPVPRSEVMDELCAAVFDGKAPLHGGEWAMATMEVCFAILDSARSGSEIRLSHQCGLDVGA